MCLGQFVAKRFSRVEESLVVLVALVMSSGDRLKFVKIPFNSLVTLEHGLAKKSQLKSPVINNSFDSAQEDSRTALKGSIKFFCEGG